MSRKTTKSLTEVALCWDSSTNSPQRLVTCWWWHFWQQICHLPTLPLIEIFDYLVQAPFLGSSEADFQVIRFLAGKLPRLKNHIPFWRDLYSRFYRESVTSLELLNEPGALYHTYIVRQTIEFEKRNRKRQLTKAFSEVGLIQRMDSRACDDWLKGLSDMSLERLVQIQIENRWIWDYHNMHQALRDYQIRHHQGPGSYFFPGGNNDPEVYRIVKAQLLAKHPLPARADLPWLRPATSTTTTSTTTSGPSRFWNVDYVDSSDDELELSSTTTLSVVGDANANVGTSTSTTPAVPDDQSDDDQSSSRPHKCRRRCRQRCQRLRKRDC